MAGDKPLTAEREAIIRHEVDRGINSFDAARHRASLLSAYDHRGAEIDRLRTALAASEEQVRVAVAGLVAVEDQVKAARPEIVAAITADIAAAEERGREKGIREAAAAAGDIPVAIRLTEYGRARKDVEARILALLTAPR